jgi:hypothetical protein
VFHPWSRLVGIVFAGMAAGTIVVVLCKDLPRRDNQRPRHVAAVVPRRVESGRTLRRHVAAVNAITLRLRAR